MRLFKDQLQRTVSVPFPPRRIISLVPSQTELLHTFGLDAEVVGITKFCIHPNAWFRQKTRIGGTKQLNMEVIRDLQPDLIIANKEENEQIQIAALAKEFPVWISDIHTLADALEMMTGVGEITDRAAHATALVKDLEWKFGAFAETEKAPKQLKVGYFIWRNPWMVAASNTFIDEMLKVCGYTNAFAKLSRYPEITTAQLQATDCDLVLLSSEPYPFSERHIAELQAVLPKASIRLVDGEMFSWYGSRLLHSIDYFTGLTKS